MTEPTARFHIIRGVGKYDAIGYAIPKDKPGPLDENPRQRWAILFIEDTLVGAATSAAYTTRTELPPENIGPAIADLMRNAARYRWLREQPIAPFPCEYPGNWRFLSDDERDKSIDAEIAGGAELE